MHHFSSLDEIMPVIELPFVLCFPHSDASIPQTVSVLREGLSKVYAKLLFLTGNLQQVENAGLRPGSFAVESNPSEPPTLSVRDMTSGSSTDWSWTYHDLRERGFPMSLLNRDVLAPTDPCSGRTRLLAAQANFIPGGCLLYVSTSHAFADAFGLSTLLCEWSRQCRDALGTSDEIPNVSRQKEISTALDQDSPCRSLVVQPYSPTSAVYERLKSKPILWHVLGLDWRPKERSSRILMSQIPPSPVRSCIFSITANSVEKLRQVALGGSSGVPKSSQSISTDDALGALLWSCLMRARLTERESFENPKEATMMRAVNVRKLLSVPETHLGNTILYAVTKLSIDLLATRGTDHLNVVAQSLRESLDELRDSSMVQEAVELANNIPDVRGMGLSFPTWVAENMVFSSLSRLPLLDWDFGSISHGGLGKPDRMRFPDKCFEGITFTMPQRPDGSLEIMITMKAVDMEILMTDQTFTEFFSFVSE
ncbi:hypothetical protein HAV15_010466 [Penicillium sp. str. |nr:hypothetical protein HAV15_010466 [Penicillium sp. str. \